MAREVVLSEGKYICKDRLLHRLIPVAGEVQTALVVPRPLQEEILLAVHEGLLGGHFGRISKTFAILRTRYYWNGMYGNVENFVKSCIKYAQHKRPKVKTKVPLHQLSVTRPFHRLAIHICGPFPKSDRGNKYIICCTGSFTK